METREHIRQPLDQSVGRRHAFHRKVFYFLCLLVAFFIPVHPRILPPLIALMVLNWLVDGQFIRVFPALFRDRQRRRTLALSLIWFLYLAGMLWSVNLEYGWFDLQVKLSLLVFPLLFATTDKDLFDTAKIRCLFFSFVAGCFAGSLLLLGNSAIQYFVNGIPGAFYYRNLSWFFHPGYIAMYYIFSLAIIAWSLLGSASPLPGWFKITAVFLLLWFFVLVILLSSKAGILGMILVAFLASGYIVISRKQYVRGILVLAGFAVLLAAGLWTMPYAVQRIGRAGEVVRAGRPADPGLVDGTAERMEVWKASLEVIRDHPVLGTGTGDVKDELIGKYSRDGMEGAFSQKLNAHNQYLQTFAALGIGGFLVLAAMILLPFLDAIRKRDLLYLMFLLVFGLNIAVESMLETQAGVVFYAFFNSFLLWNSQNRDPEAAS